MEVAGRGDCLADSFFVCVVWLPWRFRRSRLAEGLAFILRFSFLNESALSLLFSPSLSLSHKHRDTRARTDTRVQTEAK